MLTHARLPAFDGSAASTRDASQVAPAPPGKHTLVEQLFADPEAAPGRASGSSDSGSTGGRPGSAARPAAPDAERLSRLFGPPPGAATPSAPHDHEGTLADD